MLKIKTPVTIDWQHAADRAAEQRKLGKFAIPVPGEPRTYTCPSSNGSGKWYRQYVHNPTMLHVTCDCPHGSLPDAKGRCWHKVSALAAEVRRTAPVSRVRSNRPLTSVATSG